MSPSSPQLSVVLPVFNEAANLHAIDLELAAVLADIGWTAEVIYVDDGSTDASPEILGEIVMGAGTLERRVVRLRRNYGQTAALAAGFEAARGEVIVSLDADGQNDPADIARLLERFDEGWDVVSGWRRQRREPWSRRLPSWAANRLIALLSGVALHDSGCTLKAYRASLLHEVPLWGDMHRFIPAYLARAGARISELEVSHRPRRHGTSHYGGERIVKVLLDLVMIRFMTRYFTRPMHFFGQAALVLFVLSLVALACMVIFKYGWLRAVGIDYRASFVETPLPALAATFGSGGLTALFFGVLGEILVRLYHEDRRFKPYSIASTLSSEDASP